MEINFDGEIVKFSAGDGIFIPSSEKHRHIASVHTGTVQLILVEEEQGSRGDDWFDARLD